MSRSFPAASSALLVHAAVVVLIAVVGAASVPASALAQATISLVVREQAASASRCFETGALRHRIEHYSAEGLEGNDGLQLELEAKSSVHAELRIYRDAELVALRQFENLPQACADRRDAVALAIALALDGVRQELMTADKHDDASGGGTASQSGGGTAPGQSRVHDAWTAPAIITGEEAGDALEPRTPASSVKPAASVDLGAQEADKPGSLALEPQDGPKLEVSDAQVVRLHAGGRWLAEALPSPVWTGMLGAELWVHRAIAIDLSAMASTVEDSPLAGAHAESSLIGGELVACAMKRFGDFMAEGCAGAVAAACEASGRAYPEQRPAATVLWLAGTSRLALRWPEDTAVSVRLVVQGHLNAVRPQLRVAGSSEALSASLLGASTGLDLLVALE